MPTRKPGRNRGHPSSPHKTPDATRGRLPEITRLAAFTLVLLGAAVGPLVPTMGIGARQASGPGFTIQIIIHMFFVIAGALWLIAAALEGQLRIRRLGIGPWWLLFAGTLLAALVNADYKHKSLLTTFLWLSNMVAFFVLVNTARSRRARLFVLGAICASTLVISLHAIHQHEIAFPDWLSRISHDPAAVLRSLNMPPQLASDLHGRIGSRRVFSTFVLPNSFAGFLALACPAFLGLFLDRCIRTDAKDRRFNHIAGAVLFLPMLLAFIFTRSKGGTLALLAAALVFVAWVFNHTLRKHRKQIIICIAALALITGIAQVSGLFATTGEYLGSFRVRAGYWRAGLLLIEERPFTGVGLENFSDFYAHKKRPGDQEVRRAHNDYVQIAAEIGLVGLLTYLAAWCAFWRRIRRTETEPILPPTETKMPQAPLIVAAIILALATFFLAEQCGGALQGNAQWFGQAWPLMLLAAWIGVMLFFVNLKPEVGPARNSYAFIGLAAGLVGFLVHSLLDFDHYVPGIFQTVWIFMALLLAAHLSEEQKKWAVNRQLGIISRLLIILLATASAFLCSHYMVIRITDAHALRERAIDAQNLKEKQKLVEQAIALWPWDAQNHAHLAALVLGRNYQLGAGGQSSISQAITHMREAIRLNPSSADFHSRLGWIYEQRWIYSRPRNPEDWQNALNAYSRAETLAPSIPDTALNLARIHDLAGQYDAALGKYYRALRISRNHYHIWRQFSAQATTEINTRANQLKKHISANTPIAPPKFTDPRLHGLPPTAWVAN